MGSRSERATVPLSYLVKQSQLALCSWPGYMARVLYNLGAGNVMANMPDGDAWRKDRQRLTYPYGGNDYRGIAWVEFDYKGLDPVNSEWVYGKTQVSKSETEEIAANAYLLDNTANDTPLDFSQDETVTLSQSRSTETTEEISIDLGSKTTGTIGGDDFGAKLEQEISANFGWKTDESKAESESKDQSTTRHIATTVEPGNATLVTIETTRVTSATPFSAHGPWIAGVTLHCATGWDYDAPWRDAWHRTAKHVGSTPLFGDEYEYSWATLDEFLATLQGENTDTPHFTKELIGKFGWLGRGIDDPKSRYISVVGTQRRDYQSGAEVRIADVSGQDLDKVAREHSVPGGHVVVS